MSIKKLLWTVVGVLSLILGLSLASIPGPPGLPFYIFAVYCADRGLDWFHDWLMRTWIGEAVYAWQIHQSLTRIAKRNTIILMSIFTTASWFIIDILWVLCLGTFCAICFALFLIYVMPTAPHSSKTTQPLPK